jgi:3-dehydroquinate synthase
VRVGRGALDLLVDDLAARPPGRLLAVVSDSRVGPIHAEPLFRRLRRRGLPALLLTFPAGERHKTRATKSRLEDELLAVGAGRDTAIVAVGGGVTGDLAGFLAATWHRGIPVVQVPTSLLAMVDAALGGKTAVNLPGGKNLVGAFHQPWGLYADPAVLGTLPAREWLGGLSEVVKTAAIADERLFEWLEAFASALRGREPAAVDRAVTACLRIKASIVRLDPLEQGRRAILNFGHTVAHALETVTRYRIPHGRAVALGMAVEVRLAMESTGFPAEHALRLHQLLETLQGPLRWPAGADAAEVARTARRDKKTREGRARYALPVRLGKMAPGSDVTVTLSDSRLMRAIRSLSSGQVPASRV